MTPEEIKALATLLAAIIGAAGLIIAALIRRNTIRESRTAIDAEVALEDGRSQLTPTREQLYRRVKEVLPATLVLTGGAVALIVIFIFARAEHFAAKEYRSQLNGRWHDTLDANTTISITDGTITYETDSSRLTKSIDINSGSSIWIDHCQIIYGFEPDGHMNISVPDHATQPLTQIAGRYRRPESAVSANNRNPTE